MIFVSYLKWSRLLNFFSKRTVYKDEQAKKKCFPEFTTICSVDIFFGRRY